MKKKSKPLLAISDANNKTFDNTSWYPKTSQCFTHARCYNMISSYCQFVNIKWLILKFKKHVSWKTALSKSCGNKVAATTWAWVRNLVAVTENLKSIYTFDLVNSTSRNLSQGTN